MKTKRYLIQTCPLVAALLTLSALVQAQDSPRGGATSHETDRVPPGYQLVTATDFGKRIETHKAEAVSVQAALKATLSDLSSCFDSTPAAKGGFLDAQHRSRGGAPFTAQLHGQLFQGMIVCSLNETGTDITVAYCRADKLSSDWSKLAGSQGARNEPAKASANMTVYSFPDGTGSIQLPEGWRTSAKTSTQGIYIQGPAGQVVTIGQKFTAVTPNSRLAPMSIQNGFTGLFVAPHTGPVEALKNLVPEMNQRAQRQGKPVMTAVKILEPPKPVPNLFPNGQAAVISYAFTRIAAGVSTPCRALAWMETFGDYKSDSWSMYMNEIVAPDASFDRDRSVMVAIVKSEKLNVQAVQQATANQIANNNRRVSVFEQGIAAQQKNADMVLSTMQHSQLIQSRSADDFDEVIRGTREVKNLDTGESRDVSLYDASAVVDSLNQKGGANNWIEVPLRDKSDPLPNK
jgi:hypothetical protein